MDHKRNEGSARRAVSMLLCSFDCKGGSPGRVGKKKADRGKSYCKEGPEADPSHIEKSSEK